MPWAGWFGLPFWGEFGGSRFSPAKAPVGVLTFPAPTLLLLPGLLLPPGSRSCPANSPHLFSLSLMCTPPPAGPKSLAWPWCWLGAGNSLPASLSLPTSLSLSRSLSRSLKPDPNSLPPGPGGPSRAPPCGPSPLYSRPWPPARLPKSLAWLPPAPPTPQVLMLLPPPLLLMLLLLTVPPLLLPLLLLLLILMGNSRVISPLPPNSRTPLSLSTCAWPGPCPCPCPCPCPGPCPRSLSAAPPAYLGRYSRWGWGR